jgi:hypothetical protein
MAYRLSWLPRKGGAAPPLAVLLAALVLASLARYRLVEPADLTAACDAAPWQGAACALRTLTVQAFAGQRLGGLALFCALLALMTRWRGPALLALAAGGAGLVLYSTGLAVPAVLVAALVLVRPAKGA